MIYQKFGFRFVQSRFFSEAKKESSRPAQNTRPGGKAVSFVFEKNKGRGSALTLDNGYPKKERRVTTRDSFLAKIPASTQTQTTMTKRRALLRIETQVMRMCSSRNAASFWSFSKEKSSIICRKTKGCDFLLLVASQQAQFWGEGRRMDDGGGRRPYTTQTAPQKHQPGKKENKNTKKTKSFCEAVFSFLEKGFFEF